MSLYSESLVPVPDSITALHRDEVEDFSQPGCWLTGEERLATVQAAREARERGGLQTAIDYEGEPPAALLPQSSLEFIELLTLHPQRLTRQDYLNATSTGMSAGEYVETVSLVSRLINLDVFARGVGTHPLSFVRPAPGEPSYESPSTRMEGAWLPTVPTHSTFREAAEAAYGGLAPQPFIYRAISLVPREARRCMLAGDLQYLPLNKFFDFEYSPHEGLTRAETEIIAARISASNDCFY